MNAIEHRPLDILLGIDGSEHAMAAVHAIHDLRLPPGSQVTALAVLTPRETPPRHKLLAALDQAEAALQGCGAEIRTGLAHGHPAVELVKAAEHRGSDLLVVGATGLRATLGILLGGVAQQVVEYASLPVMVVRAPHAGLRRVLLATDGSPDSAHVAEYLTRLPLPSGASVEVMHVLPPAPVYEPVSPVSRLSRSGFEQFPPPGDLAESEEKQGQSLLNRTLETLDKGGLTAAKVLARGDAASEIIEHAKASSTDLIVAGSRGLSEVQGWMLGSVTRKLVHYAPCSVLIVRPESAPVP